MNSPDSGAFYDAHDVKRAANGRWTDVLGRFGADTRLLVNAHGRCPGCGGKDRFRFDDDGGNGTFICSQGGGELLAGDGVGLLMHITGWEWKRCIQELGRELGVEPLRGHRLAQRKREEEERGAVAPEPTAEKSKRPELDRTGVWEFTRGLPEIDARWMMRRSPVDVASCTTQEFLGHLYRDEEAVLVFTNEMSQGDFCAWIRSHELGAGPLDPRPVKTFRLAQERGVKGVPSALPTGGPKGVWFLTNPVTGTWAINPRAKAKGGNEKQPQWSRRSQESVTAWRYYVLESDELEASDWLKVLAQIQLPIAAIYTSGGRSIHALVQLEVPSKAHWDAVRDSIRDMVCPLGADTGALSAVRLSRLPGCTRGLGVNAKRQTLLYLNPNPADHRAIRLMPELR